MSLSKVGNETAIAQLGNNRWPYWENNLCNERYPYEKKIGGWWFCMLKKPEPPNVFLLGNSHANDLYPAFAENNEFEHLNILSAGTCSYLGNPRPNVDADKNNPCSGNAVLDQYAYTEKILDVEKPQFVFLNVSHKKNMNQQEIKDFVSRNEIRVRAILSRGLTPIVLGPRPKLGFHVKNCFNRHFGPIKRECSVAKVTAMQGFVTFGAQLHKNIQSIDGAFYLSQEDFFCQGESCSFMKDGLPLVRDDGVEHLSPHGAKLFGEYIAGWANQQLPDLLSR